MESLSKTLTPYKETIGNAASLLTIFQFFSGGFVCWDIRKRGNTEKSNVTPFVGGLAMGIAMYKYGVMLDDPAMLQVNIVAILTNIAYTIFFYSYASDKWNEVLKPLSIGSAVAAALLGYTEVEDPKNVEFRFGLIVTILMLMLLGAPLVNVKKIIEKKDASEIPFVLTLMGALVTFSWLLYAIILKNSFMIIQNVVGFALCAVQLVLIFLYPGQPGKTSQSFKKKKH